MGAVTIPQAFDRVLREFRTKSGLSQEQLALNAGMDRTYISLLERGLRQPTLSTLFRLARILDVAPANMVARTAAMTWRGCM
jgi:transcriptional regulator with XRE-family HTH domain